MINTAEVWAVPLYFFIVTSSFHLKNNLGRNYNKDLCASSIQAQVKSKKGKKKKASTIIGIQTKLEKLKLKQ